MSSGEATMAWVAARSGEGERAEWQLRQPPSQNEAPKKGSLTLVWGFAKMSTLTTKRSQGVHKPRY